MRVEEFEGKAVVTTKVSLRVAQLAENVFVYRRSGHSKMTERSGALGIPSNLRMGKNGVPTTSTGFVDAANLDKLKQGKPYSTLQLHVFDPKLIEAYRTEGWNLPYRDKEAQKQREGWMVEDPFKALVEEGRPLEHVVRWAHESHMIFGLSGEPLPVARRLNYIDFRVSERTYDLRKMAEVLLARKDVIVWKDPSNDYREPEVAKTPQEAITSIPHYNASRGRALTIYFKWMPSVADYRTVWKQCLTYKSKYPSTEFHRAMFDTDILGLRAAGATLCKEFHGDVPYEGGDSYDD